MGEGVLGKGAALGGRRAVELPRDGARREGLMAEGHLVQRGCRAHLQMLEVGTLGIVADDSLHEVPGQQQAAGVLSGYPAGVWDSQVPEVWARQKLGTAVACVAPAGAGVVHGSPCWRASCRAILSRTLCATYDTTTKRRATSDDHLLVGRGGGG